MNVCPNHHDEGPQPVSLDPEGMWRCPAGCAWTDRPMPYLCGYCGRAAFEWNDGVYRCTSGHVTLGDVDEAAAAELGGDAA